MTASHETTLESVLRDATPHVLGAVVRRFRDFAAAEDAVQEALLAASLQWPQAGFPDDPRAWLVQVASRRFTDTVRSEMARRRRHEALAAEPGRLAVSPATPEPEEDDTLVLLFMCCHPVLTGASAIALTLRAVGGLTTREIAHAFLVPEPTMAQRISRAKQTIQTSKIPFRLPTSEELTQRLQSVMHVLYLIFNEGYTSSSGYALHRTDLSSEAIRLTRVLHELVPGNPEVMGLLALMLLTDARRLARTGAGGELILLDEQDRALWNRAHIAEGTELLKAALSKGSAGPYQLQAAISAIHDEAETAEATDWPQILALYELLGHMSDNPMVLLNRAIAAAMVHGPRTGLALLEELGSRLAGHHRLHATKAHLLEMAGDHPAAIAHYRLAADATASIPERNYLVRRAARLAG